MADGVRLALGKYLLKNKDTKGFKSPNQPGFTQLKSWNTYCNKCTMLAPAPPEFCQTRSD